MPLSPFAEVSQKNSKFIAKYWLLGEDDPLSRKILETMTGGNSEEIKQLLKDEADIDLDDLFSPIRVTVCAEIIDGDLPENILLLNLVSKPNSEEELIVTINFFDKLPDIAQEELVLWVTNQDSKDVYPNYSIRSCSSC